MAEYTINHNIFEGRGAQKSTGGAKKSAGVNETKLAKEIGKVMDKVSKDSNKTLSTELSKQLEISLRRVLRNRQAQGPAGRPSDKPVTKADIERIVKNVSVDTANSILREMAKSNRSGSPQHTRSAEAVFKNMDKQIAAAIGKLTTSLSSKTGVELGPEGAKIIAESVGKAIRSTVSTELGKAVKEASKTYQSIQRSADATVKAVDAISKLKSSGGGIDVTEIPKVISALITLRKESKELSNDYKELSRSVKTLTKDQEGIMKELGNAVSEVKAKLSQKISSVKDVPGKILDSGKFKKVFDDFLKKFERISKDIELEYKPSAGQRQIAAPEVKQLETTMKTTNKKLDDLTTAIVKSSKSSGGAASGGAVDLPKQEIKGYFKEIRDLIRQVIKESQADLARMTKEVGAGRADPKELRAITSDQQGLEKALKSMNPTTIKTAAGGAAPVAGQNAKKLDQLRVLVNDVQKKINKPPVESDKEFKTGLRAANEAAKRIEKAAGTFDKAVRQPTAKPVPTAKPAGGQASREVSGLIKQIELMNSRLRGPSSVSVYPEVALPATKKGIDLNFEGTFGSKGQQKQKQLIQNRINDLSSSLVDLQDYIVNTLNEEFKKSGDRWSIVKDGTERGIQDFFKIVQGGNVKESGKQHAFQIADVAAIKKQLFLKGRGAATKGTPASMVKELTDALATELSANFPAPADLTGKIAEWLKSVTSEQIKQVKEIRRYQTQLVDIKEGDIKGVLPGDTLIKQLTSVLGKDRATLEQVFKATAGRSEASRSLKEQKLVRTVSLPAARLTKTGTPAFETARGSKRALQRFATFKTGFEKLYEDLANQQALSYQKGFAGKIREVGVKPTGLKLDKAQDLAKDILGDFAKVSEKNLQEIRKQIPIAANVKFAAIGGSGSAGGAKLLDDVKKALKANEVDKNIDTLLDAINAAGVSAYEVVKSMDKIEFENIYDILQRVLKGKAGGIQPLKGLGENPQFDKFIRDYENSINQVVQSLPIIEPGRPRRGLQQESVVNLLTRTSDIYSGESRKDLGPEDQKAFIKDLNVRLNEIVRESALTNQQLLKEGVRTITTLGIPEALAGKGEFYRPGQTDQGTKYLGALDAFSTKMYTDILPELSPFGAQFTQLGRNIAGTTNAISSSKAQLDRLSQEFKSTTLEGYGTEFPTLRTERESDLISSGRFGEKGYGFNVITELRHTAGTMEDQILVSGNLAKALTSITKTLVRPAPGGRIRGGLDTAPGVSELQAGPIKDKDISRVLDQIQEVLGVPEKYKGRADQAFLDDIRRAITVVRGEEVEVQQARLTEVFLNKFGRKITSRYGSKGVSVTPTGLGEEQAGEIGDIIKSFPKAKIKVLTEEERSSAGLGVALRDRSAGDLFSDVLDKYQKQLESEGFDVTTLKKMLTASGNKFILKLFKDANEALVVPEEATQQRGVFDKAAKAFESITGDKLAGDVLAKGQIEKLFSKEVGGPLTKERAIDVRVSSVGIGKRGLQPEVLESIVNNIANVGERGFTTIPTKFSQSQYEKLLGTGGKPGQLSNVSSQLGFETVGSPDEISQLALDLGERKGKIIQGTDGKDIDTKAIIAQRAAALEAMSSYYTTVIDEFGEQRKSIVGEKFLSIIQEPGETEPWRQEDIRRGVKGASVDIPVFSAYSTVFGEQSALLNEITETTNANQRKQLEFLKALQFMADETGTLQERQLSFLQKATLADVKYFDQSTGILSEQANDNDPRNLSDTVFDVKKFPKPFSLQIPKSGGEAGETEPFYVPGALARGTYAEELIGGERGVENIGRRLQHVVNMAKKANELLERPATLEADIKLLESELTEATRRKDPAAGQLETQLISKKASQQRLLSGEGALSSTVKSRITQTIGDFLKEAQTLKYAKEPTAEPRLQEIFATIKNALSKTEAPAEAFRVKRGVNLRPGASELENVEAFFKRQQAQKGTQPALSEAIGKASDLIIGKGPGAQDIYNTIIKGIAELKQNELGNIDMFKKVLQSDPSFKKKVDNNPQNILKLLEEKNRYMQSEMQATEQKLFRLAKDVSSGQGLELAARLNIDVDKELQFKYEEALDKLQKAKIDYFHSLAEAAVGKEGAIGTAVFSRKFPAVMKKATTAIVDRTQEFAQFQDALKSIKGKLPESEMSKLDSVLSGIGKVSASHGKKVAIQRRAGFPVLRQHELGIPEVTAGKLPVEFEKKIQFDKKGPRTQTSKVDGTLLDLLKYRERLEGLVGDDGDLSELAQQELERTKTFVEAIRYPFTGVSSIVPYEPKLLSGAEGDRAKNAFVVPGAPELEFDKLNKILEPVEDIIDGLHAQREKLFKQADISGTEVDRGKVDELSNLMDELASAVSAVTPKYAAHTAKLDFDGDEIAVHTARTRAAREEIADHHKSIVEFGKGLQEVYRNIFTAEALGSQQPTGQAILAEMAENFYKKFPKEKGFEFLVKPFLTGQASLDADAPPGATLTTPSLEYAGRGEQLSILGLGGEGITKTLEGIIQDTIQGPQQGGFVKALEPFKELETNLPDVRSETGVASRVSFVEDMYKAIENLDSQLSTSFVEQIQAAVTSRLFESKYRDAVEAQLFKIHTGIETEALYRLSRLAESNVGFGSGFVGKKGTFKPSEEFAGRNPNLDILGGSDKAVAQDFYAKFNEVFRFALQKGMDVKHAGGRSIAGEIESQISQGYGGVTKLWDSLVNDEMFGELQDFEKSINKTTKTRLGKIDTKTIRKELEQLYEARGTEYSPAELNRADRDKLIDLAVEATGLKSFFSEMASQVQEGAIKGIEAKIKTLSPEKRAAIGDPGAYARSLVKEETSSGGVNVREHITAPNLPLYILRQESGLGKQEKRYKEKYGDVSVPPDIKFLRKGSDEVKDILTQYKQAKATAQNIQDAIAQATEGLGGGAYAALVRSTLDNIHRDQAEIEREFKTLSSEGFDIGKIDRSLENLKERTLLDKELPELTKNIISKGPSERVKEIERLADLVGVPTLTKEEKIDVSEKLLKDFRKQAEKVASQDTSLSDEDLEKKADELTNQLAEKATLIYEMDRIIDVMGTRAKEGITLLSLFPREGDLPKIDKSSATKSYEFGQEMRDVRDQGQAQRDKQKELYRPGGPGGPLGGGIGGTFPMEGGIVPVHIHSIAQGVGMMFGGEAMGSRRGATEPLSAEFESQTQAKSRLAEMNAQVATHDEESYLKTQRRIKKEFKNVEGGFDRHEGRFDDPKFQKILQDTFPGSDVKNYKDLKSKFFTDTTQVFSGSKFKGGGEDVVKLKQGKRRESQLEGISKLILGAESGGVAPGAKKQLDPSTQAAFDIGTALHAKLQRKIKKEMDAIGKNVDIEKFVYLNPQEFVEGIQGPITGFIDVAYKNAQGQVEKISDIKTTGETFAKFESISKAVGPAGTIELADILDKDIPGHIRQKLEEYRSQLNIYLAALIQSGQAAPGVQAAIEFIPSEDTELTTPAKSVTFGFDPERLQSDLETLHEARTLIKDYVHNLDTEIKDVPTEYQELVSKLRASVSGKSPGASRARTLESYQLEEKLDNMFGVVEQSDEFVEEFVDLSKNVFDFMQGQENVYKEASGNFKNAQAKAKEAGQGMKDKPEYGRPKFERQSEASKERVKSFREPLQEQFGAIQDLQEASLANLFQQTGFEFNDQYEKSHTDIQDALKKGQKPPTGPEFSQKLEKLVEGGFISFRDSIEAWRMWRVVMSDFLINQAREAEQAFEIAQKTGIATREFTIFQKAVDNLVGEKGFISKSIGKKSDIYTTDRRFLAPESAEKAGVALSPKQIFEKTRQPFGNDESTRGIYKELLDKLESGTLGAPAEAIKDLVDDLANLDKGFEAILSDAELFKRQGDEAVDAWDFEALAKRARILREALSQYSKFNLSDEFQTDVEKKFQVRSLLQYLKQIEQVYGRIDLGKLQRGPLGEYETGAVKVPAFLPPGQQTALHRRNIQKFSQFAAKPEEEGGPQIGESFSYFEKVTDSAGNVLRNYRHDFRKFAETVEDGDEVVGKFSKTQTDLIEKMQMSGGTFRSAAKRVIMWGAAATLVYGGVQALKDSIGELADIEMSIAQLRMVMNPLESDFDALTQSAIDFAKSYGVGVNEVLRSMKIFAQQGLAQSEVIDRARVSTLASNVSTLSAAEATEALTAAMKSFGGEIGSTDMALDAWSETEARHAITAADMANAIKKSAAAAKNAGFTFNELNGIVAGIGAVTRQTGKEVGTSLRFIARRLFSEKGPKALGEIGIPTITATGENRRGFDILSDLSKQWYKLTNAQKLNIAQSLGGTRQYNSLLVALDNWDEVLEAIEDSTNSKGSAERRNIEIMKTYSKQLEQTKAAAAELKIELGKFIFPVFKGFLTGLRSVFEFMSAVPIEIKAAGAALTLFFGYAAKGVDVFDKLVEMLGRGRGAVDSFVRSISKEFNIAQFEIFGGGKGPELDGLKSFAKGIAPALKAAGVDDLHSGFGKLAFVIKAAGDAFNQWAAAGGEGAAAMGQNIEALGDEVEKWARRTDLFTDIGQLLATKIPGWKDDLTFAVINVMEEVAKNSGKGVEIFGKYFGAAGEEVAKFLGDTDPSLLKSLTPLAATIGVLIPAFSALAGKVKESGQTAQEYAQSVYNERRVHEDQIKTLTTLGRQYDRINKKIKEVNEVEANPKLKQTRKDSDNYTHPLLALGDAQQDATKWANELARTNNNLVLSYDAQGNAILKLSGDYETYLADLQRASALELAKTDIDILAKFTKDLTKSDFGESFKNILNTALGEIPGFGPLLKDLIKISPAKQMEMLTSRLNDLLVARSENPLSTAFNADIETLQDALGKLKNLYDGTAQDFQKTLAGIFKFPGASAVGRDTISRLLSDPVLTEGFELIAKINPVIDRANIANTIERNARFPEAIDLPRQRIESLRAYSAVPEITGEDIVGSTNLKLAFPQKRAIIGASKEITVALLESAGIVKRATKAGAKLLSGDIVTFLSAPAESANIQGAQAVVELKKNVDGVLEAFVTYYDTETNKLETKPLADDKISNMVESIFPATRIMNELENRLENLSTFVTGAGAGIAGLDEKAFKKDFDLGARFYSDVPTTTALQGSKGFNFQSESFGDVTDIQKEWAVSTRKYFLEPMAKYNKEVSRFDKAGSLEKTSDVAEEDYQRLIAQQSVLKNNQVVVQYAAVFADLSKTMEESTRALEENLAVEKSRQEAVKMTSGLMKGIPEGFDSIDTGIRRIQDLSVKQLAARNQPNYRNAAGRFREQDVRRQAIIGQIESVNRAKVAIETITATQGGLGTILGQGAGPEEIAGFIEKTVALGDVAAATLSKDINNLEKANHRGFVDVVDSLETLVSQGQKGEVLTDKIVSLQERVTDYNAKGGALQGGIFDSERRRIGFSIASELHKTSRARFGAAPEEQGVLNERLNVLTDTMLQLQGLQGGQASVTLNPRRAIPGFSDSFLSSPFTSSEFTQRAFRGLQPNELTEKFKTGDTGPSKKLGLGLGYSPFAPIIPKLKNVPGFGKSEEFKELIAIAEEEKKLSEKTFFNSKNLLKTAAAVAAFQAFNKGNSSAALVTLKEQLVGQKAVLSEAKKAADEGRVGKAETEISSLNKAIEKEQKALDFHKIVASLANLETGTLALARAFGFSETNVKRVGGASLVLYAAMQAASAITGEELPAAAKKFGKDLVSAVGDTESGGDFSPELINALKGSGKELLKASDKRFKEVTGGSKAALDKIIQERLTGIKNLSEVEIEQRAKDLREAAKKEGAGGLKKILAAALASTLAGTFAELTGPGVRKAEISRLSERRGDILTQITSKWPEVAQLIVDELLAKSKAAGEGLKSVAPGDTQAQSQYLDVINQNQKAAQVLVDKLKSLYGALGITSENMGTLTDEMYKFELFEGLRKQVMDFARDMANAAVEFEVSRNYNLGAALNPSLRGFSGDAQLPASRREMSTQQRMFASGGGELQNFMTSFRAASDAISKTEQQLVTLEQTRLQYQEDGVYNQVSALDGMDKQISGLKDERETLTSDRQKAVDESRMQITERLIQVDEELKNAEEKKVNYLKTSAGQNAESGKTLDSLISKQKQYHKSLSDIIDPAGKAYVGMTKLSEAMFRFGDAMREVSIQDAIDELQSVKDFRAQTDKFLGGSSPYAAQSVSPEEEYQAAKGGIRLTDLVSTAQEKERGNLYASRTTATGQQRADIDRQIGFLPEKYRRLDQAQEQRRNDDRFSRQTSPVLQLMSELESLSRNEVIDPELKKAILALRDQAGGSLQRSNEVTDGFRRGIPLEESQGLVDQYEKIRQAILDTIPEDQLGGLGIFSDQQIMVEQLIEIGRSGTKQVDLLTTISESLKPPMQVIMEKTGFFAAGGTVSGPGGPTDDKIMARLSAGEFVINQKSATKLGRKNLEHLNKYGVLPGLQAGGYPYEPESLGQLRNYEPFVGPPAPKGAPLGPSGIYDPTKAAREQHALSQKLGKIIEEKISAVQTARENIIELNKKDVAEGRAPQGIPELVDLNKKLLQLQEQRKLLQEAQEARENKHEESRLRLIEENKTGFSKVDSSINIQTDKTATGQGQIKQSIDAQTGVLTDQSSILSNIDGGIGALLDAIKAKAPEMNRQAFVDKGYDPHEAERLRRIQKVPYTDPRFNVKGPADPRTEHEKRMGRASGGKVFGEGGPKEDKIPAMLSNGEFVIRQAAASKLGLSDLEYMNKHGEVPKFADGGLSGPKSGISNELVSSRDYDKLKEYMRPISTITGKKIPTAPEKLEGSLDAMKAMTSFILDAVPGVGDAKSLQEGVSGKDMITGEDLGIIGSALALIATLPVIPGTLKNLRHGIDPFVKTLKSQTKAFSKPLMNQIGTIGELDLDTLARLPLKDRIKHVMEIEGIPSSKTGEMTAAANKLLGDVADPTKDLLAGAGKRTPADGLSKRMSLIKYADKKSTEFADLYPDVFQKVKGGKAKFKDIDRFTKDPSVGGSFFSRSEPAENLTMATPYEIALNEKILDVKNPGSIATVINHEGFHAVAQFVRDKFAKKILDTNVIDKQLKAQKDFIDSFAKRKPFTDIAERNVGDSNFGSENFAEFARSVHQGHIKSDLSAEFNELFNPKFFQTGQAFAEGGEVKDVKGWLDRVKEFFLGSRDVEAEKKAGKAGSYFTSKETKKNLLDAADPNNDLGMGGRAKKKHYADGGKVRRFEGGPDGVYEVDELGGYLDDQRALTPRTERDSFLRNKAYRVGVGRTDPEPVSNKGFSRPANFAVKTAGETGRRFGEEYAEGYNRRIPTGIHSQEELLAHAESTGNVKLYNQIVAERSKTIQRENRQALKYDPEVYDALRNPGNVPSPKGKGLFNYKFDSKTGVVSAEGLSHGVQSKYDLNELAYQERKRAMEEGRLPLPEVEAGYKDTASDPRIAAQDARRKAYKLQLVTGQSRKSLQGDAGEYVPEDPRALLGSSVLGRDTEVAFGVYTKLKYLAEHDPEYKNVHAQLALAEEALQADALSPLHQRFLSRMRKDDKFNNRFKDIKSLEDDKKYGIKNAQLAFLSSPHLFKEYMKHKNSGNEAAAEAAKRLLENARLSEEEIAGLFGKAKESGTTDELAMLFGKFGGGKNNKFLELAEQQSVRKHIQIAGQGRREDFEKKDRASARDILGQMLKTATAYYKDTDIYQKFFGNKSMPVMHNGGMVPQTGPIFAQKGEMVLPTGFADGGLVDDSMTKASLSAPTITVDATKAVEDIKNALASTEVKIEDGATVKVDTEGISIPVDVGTAMVGVDTAGAVVEIATEGVSVTVDATAAAGEISAAVSQALANVTLDVNSSTGAVGADDIDRLSAAVENVQDKILTTKGELEEKIIQMETTQINSSTLKSEIQNAVDVAISRIDHDVNTNRNDVSAIVSRISRFENRMVYEVGEVNRKALDAQNFATRPVG